MKNAKILKAKINVPEIEWDCLCGNMNRNAGETPDSFLQCIKCKDVYDINIGISLNLREDKQDGEPESVITETKEGEA